MLTPPAATWPTPGEMALTLALWGVAGAAVWRVSGALPWRPGLRPSAVASRVAVHVALCGALVAVALVARGLPVGATPARWSAIWFWQVVGHAGFVAGAAAVAAAVRAGQAAHEARLATARAEAARRAADLAALRARLSPRLLAGTLGAVRRLVDDDPAAAERALEDLGDLLHYVLRLDRRGAGGGRAGAAPDDGTVALEEEWEATRAFLALERLHRSAPLVVRSDVEAEALARRVPPFVLLPLVEHAVRRARGAPIAVALRVDDADRLHLEVRGRGIAAPDASEASDAAVDTGASGLAGGLPAVRRRLAACAPGAALTRLDASADAPDGGRAGAATDGDVLRVTLPPAPRPVDGRDAARRAALRALAARAPLVRP